MLSISELGFVSFVGFVLKKSLRLFLYCLCKESKVDFAVMPLFHEVGMLLKVLVFVVFQDEHAAFAKQVVVEDELH